MADGLNWFDDGVLATAQKFSVAADLMDEAVYEVVETNAELSAEEMRQIVLSGGVNPTKKGGARVLSANMLDSVDTHIFTNGRGRVQGEIGFIDGAPDYTAYQELGTTRGGENFGGIPPMLAFATAQVHLVERMIGEFESGRWFPRIF